MDVVHRVHPLGLLLPRNANVPLVSDVNERLLEEVEVDPLPLLLAN